MHNFFDDWSEDIRSYCKENNFDFEKVCKLSKCWGISKCWGNDFLTLQFHDPTKGTKGLLDETPMPVVLIIEKTQNGLVFTKTEYTEQYLSKE